MPSSIEKPPAFQPPPRLNTLRLGAGAELMLAEGSIYCPLCDKALGVTHAELLENNAMRMLCVCGFELVHYDPAVRS